MSRVIHEEILSAVRDQGTHMHLHTRNPHDDLAQCVLSLSCLLSIARVLLSPPRASPKIAP